jgi:hypothetical protein
LFLLVPGGSTLGLVLAVLGTGVWMGVQHLGYLEFGEIRRVAQRTIDQRHIFVNNLAIRRATEELRVARDFEQVARILMSAFSANDFDAFELHLHTLSAVVQEIRGLQLISSRGGPPCLRWKKSGSHFAREMVSAWNLTLDLAASNNRRYGWLTIYRLYDQRGVQIDINLLTCVFPIALADALDRIQRSSSEVVPFAEQSVPFATAQAG